MTDKLKIEIEPVVVIVDPVGWVLVCPECGDDLRGTVDEHHYWTPLEWDEEDGLVKYSSYDSDDRESELIELTCRCGFSVDLSEQEVEYVA